MKWNVVIAFVLMFCAPVPGNDDTGAADAAAWHDPDKVEAVESGRLQEARADWWGFDPEDSTKFLQAAIDSGANRLIVPDMGKPWIVEPVSLAGNQEIIFEKDVLIEAKRGSFHGKNDSLFKAVGKKNITMAGENAELRMHKEDYRDENKYARAEWRNVITLINCENVKLSGMTLESSGGDGIYIGNRVREPEGNYCKDIVIRDCVIDDNYRQGISVISVVNLLVENCVIKNTEGTAPQSGIDFEPNGKDERLSGIVVRDCLIRDNAGNGIIVKGTGNAYPVSYTFENCELIDNKFGNFSGGLGADPDFNKYTGVMTNCVSVKNGVKTVYNDFWKEWQKMQVLDPAQQKIVNSISKLDVLKQILVPMDNQPEQPEKISMPRLRGKSAYIAYARQGEKLRFETKLERNYKEGMDIEILSPSGKIILNEKIGVGRFEPISFVAEETGAHIIRFDPHGGWFISRGGHNGETRADSLGDMLVDPKCNLAIVALDNPIHFFGVKGILYFYVPAGVRDFYVWAAGSGGERVKVSLFDASEKLVEEQDNIGMNHKFIVSRDDASRGEVWMVKLDKPGEYYLEDYSIDLYGVPPIFATDKACLLMPQSSD